MSSARPSSSGSAIMVSLLRLFGVSAKHLRALVSTTVSQNAVTGSAVLTSMSLYMRRRSCMMQSRLSSPVPKITCSPDSSTLVAVAGYDFEMRRRPSTILGSSAGFSGSTASFITAVVLNERGRKIVASSLPRTEVMVAVLLIGASTPCIMTQLPAPALSTSSRYRPSPMLIPVTSHTAMSSSSSREYASPSTFTESPTLSVPE
mmetsp:Transcript_4272/g.8861  ORF Transcript_4272/g.8861 Transcript_4272/m.8861 type:complete len:204 (-) Transcript_4272:237-848(-)